MPTRPETCRLASCTQTLPGPTITSTGATVAVPYASAAIACAPPMRYTASTSQSEQAARISGCGGAATTTSSTPAVHAVTAPMTTDDGYGLRPPGA